MCIRRRPPLAHTPLRLELPGRDSENPSAACLALLLSLSDQDIEAAGLESSHGGDVGSLGGACLSQLLLLFSHVCCRVVRLQFDMCSHYEAGKAMRSRHAKMNDVLPTRFPCHPMSRMSSEARSSRISDIVAVRLQLLQYDTARSRKTCRC